jgi:uncharacterized protein (TIGR02996 family)
VNANSEQDALLEAICAAPADDTPRLVYADWLDEHGEPEHAEFIRVQIELHNRPDTGRKRLEGRASEAWKKLKRKWRDLFAPPALFRKADCRRGFPSGTVEGTREMPVERYVALSADLWPRLPLRDVHLRCAGPVPDALLACAHLRRLTGFAVWNNPSWDVVLPEGFVVRLFSYNLFERLAVLRVGRVPLSRRVVDALRAAPYLRQLRRFDIEYLATRAGDALRGQLRFPRGSVSGHDGLTKNPGGAVKALAKALPELEEHLVVVPPGETSCFAIVDHTRRVGTS